MPARCAVGLVMLFLAAAVWPSTAVAQLVITEFTILTPTAHPTQVAAGPDGNVWFTELDGNKIGRITAAGTITEFPLTTAGSQPSGITAGPDGSLWFTERSNNAIGVISPAGVVLHEFPIPTADSFAQSITLGPDGNLSGSRKVGPARTRLGASPPPEASPSSRFPPPAPSRTGS
jgi:virginiamycin B lyase